MTADQCCEDGWVPESEEDVSAGDRLVMRPCRVHRHRAWELWSTGHYAPDHDPRRCPTCSGSAPAALGGARRPEELPTQ